MTNPTKNNWSLQNAVRRYYLVLLTGLIWLPKLEAIDSQVTFDSLEQMLSLTQDDALRAERLNQIVRFSISYGIAITKGLAHAKELLIVGKKLNHNKWIKDAHYYIGTLKKISNNYSGALAHIDTVLQMDIADQDTIGMLTSLHQKADIFRLIGKYQDALSLIVRNHSLSLAIKNQTSIARALNTKAIIYKLMLQTDKAFETYSQAEKMYEQMKDSAGLARVLHNIGNLYMKINQPSKAIEYYDLEEPIVRVLGNQLSIGHLYNSRGQAYFRTRDYKLAKSELKKSINSWHEIGDSTVLAESSIALGRTYSKLEEYEKAKTQINYGLDIAKRIGALPQVRIGHQALAETHKVFGFYKLALEQFENYEKIKDSILNESISEQTIKMEAIYESREKEAAIKHLQFQKQVQTEKVLRQKKVVFSLVLAALILATLLWRNIRLKNKISDKNKIISAALNDKEVLLKEIHHRVKNNLQLISSLLSLQSSTIDDTTALAALTEGQSRVQSMALIHQDLYRSDNLTGVQIEGYINKLCRNLFDTYNISGEKIQLELDIAPMSLDVSTLIPMGLILNELISNSLKYAFPGDTKGKIGVRLKPKSKSLLLEVWDNGKGISEDARTDGFGHKLVNTFAKKLEADVSFNRANGTVVSMQISKFKVA